MQVQAHAKINWSLDITGTREDGYHLLDMVLQPIGLCDVLTLESAPALTLRVPGGTVPSGENNLILRAAKALQAKTGTRLGADIILQKNIPSGAGLGGGSADAAAALKALNALWQLRLSDSELADIGLSLGADIPFCLLSRPARARGIGEILTPVPCARSFPLVLIQPCRPLPTPQVFEQMGDAPADPAYRPDNDLLLEGLAAGDLARVSRGMGNALTPCAAQLRPAIPEAVRDLKEYGARAAQMTGSGSVVFGVFSSRRAAASVCASLRKKYRTCLLTQTL